MNEKLISINDFVDEIYYINLDRRKDRLEHIKSELKKHDIKATRFVGVDASKLKIDGPKSRIGAIGALRSHKGIIEMALKKKQDIIVSLEDDIIFCDDFKERFDYYVKHVPANWDIMYLGCHFHGCKEPRFVGDYIYKIVECYGCFAMILNNKRGLFKKILDVIKDENQPVDNYMNEFIIADRSINAYVLKPFFVRTLDTISDISDSTESFSYDAVDQHFQKVMTYDSPTVPVPPPPPPPPKPVQPPPVTDYQFLCEGVLRSGQPFEIIHSGKVIFDSTTTDTINLSFHMGHFTLYGRVFMYQGMVIKRK